MRVRVMQGGAVAPSRPSFLKEVGVYVGRIHQFTAGDWRAYLLWVGLMSGLSLSTLALVAGGTLLGVAFPAAAWMVPIGAFVFTVAIAVDTIGHRTIYKAEISRAEGLVHAITIFNGIGSCLLLSAAVLWPDALWIPAMVMTVLSFVYSLVDEVFHWRRYVSASADRVEMWSHVGILLGHLTMMIGWWVWFFAGYPGVAQTIERAFGGGVRG